MSRLTLEFFNGSRIFADDFTMSKNPTRNLPAVVSSGPLESTHQFSRVSWCYKMIGSHDIPARMLPERLSVDGDLVFMLREFRWEGVVVKDLIVDICWCIISGDNTYLYEGLWVSSSFLAESEWWILAIEVTTGNHTYIWLVQLA